MTFGPSQWRRALHTLRAPAAEPLPRSDAETLAALAARLDATARMRLGRSLALRHVDTGSCGGCELELRALASVVYDLQRYGLSFVTSPLHADVLVVTGPLTRSLAEALEQAWRATPDPKWVVAVGDCAVDGGVFKGSYAVVGLLARYDIDKHLSASVNLNNVFDRQYYSGYCLYNSYFSGDPRNVMVGIKYQF